MSLEKSQEQEISQNSPYHYQAGSIKEELIPPPLRQQRPKNLIVLADNFQQQAEKIRPTKTWHI